MTNIKFNLSKPTPPMMPRLGKGTECVQLLLSQVSKDMHQPLVPMLFPILGAHVSGAEFMYPDQSWKEMCGMLANLVADSGAGKGQLSGLVEALCRDFRAHDEEELAKLNPDFSLESFMQIVYRLNHARRIFVVGHHLTRIVADFFLYQLKRIGREAHLVDTSDKKQTCDRLLHATKEDVFVLISIPVYAELTIQLAQHLREAEITSISITDSLTSPVAQACEMSLTCNTEHDVLFNSVSSMIAMIEVLTSGLLLSDRERFLTAQERLERLEEKLGIPQKDQQFVRTDIQRQTLK